MKLHEMQAKDKETWVRPKPCCVCGKVIAGAYGRDHEDNWTCSKRCNDSKESIQTRNGDKL